MLASQNRVLLAAQATRRRFFASLPLHYRLARVFIVLGSAYTQAFARGIYALFLIHGVKGMPEVDPDSPLGKAIARKDKNLARYMPTNYAVSELNRFTRKLEARAMKVSKNPAQMPDILSAAFERLIENHRWQKIDPERGLEFAEAFVATTVTNVGIDLFRKNKHDDKGQSITVMDDEGGEGQRDLHDESADFGSAMDTKEVMDLLEDPDVVHDLRGVHPDAPLFIKLMLDGYTQKEILGNPPAGIPSMLPHWKFGPTAWQPKPDRGYGVNIMKTLRNHILDSNSGRPQDRALSFLKSERLG